MRTFETDLCRSRIVAALFRFFDDLALAFNKRIKFLYPALCLCQFNYARIIGKSKAQAPHSPKYGTGLFAALASVPSNTVNWNS